MIQKLSDHKNVYGVLGVVRFESDNQNDSTSHHHSVQSPRESWLQCISNLFWPYFHHELGHADKSFDDKQQFISLSKSLWSAKFSTKYGFLIRLCLLILLKYFNCVAVFPTFFICLNFFFFFFFSCTPRVYLILLCIHNAKALFLLQTMSYIKKSVEYMFCQ